MKTDIEIAQSCTLLPITAIGAKLGLTEDAMAAGKAKAESMRVVKKDSFFNKFFKAISGCILPMIAPMAAGGIIKGVPDHLRCAHQ